MVRSVLRACAVMVAAFALFVPATAAADSGYSTSTTNDSCAAYGLNGQIGYGMELASAITSAGSTHAIRLSISSKMQKRDGGSWVVVKRYPTKTASFADNGSSHRLGLDRTATFYGPGDGGATAQHRLVLTLRAVTGAGTSFVGAIKGRPWDAATCPSV